jgi:hypothetical protein
MPHEHFVNCPDTWSGQHYALVCFRGGDGFWITKDFIISIKGKNKKLVWSEYIKELQVSSVTILSFPSFNSEPAYSIDVRHIR